jgi:hypothetical protein
MTVIPFLFHHTTDPHTAKGVRISAFGNANTNGGGGEYSAKGVWIGGIYNGSGDFTGVEVAGLLNMSDGVTGVAAGAINVIEGELSGASLGAVNYAEENGRFSLQIGAINYLKNFYVGGTVVQIGLYNQAGNQAIPLLNIRRKKKNKLERSFDK